MKTKTLDGKIVEVKSRYFYAHHNKKQKKKSGAFVPAITIANQYLYCHQDLEIDSKKANRAF